MGTGLYRDLPAFAALMDEVFRAMGTAGAELRSEWLAADPAFPIDHVGRSQPLLFAIDYALGRLLIDLGLRPAVLLGHSIGEMAAALLAGVFDLDSVVRILQHRVHEADRAPAGGMAAVSASAAEVAPYLRPGMGIGAINAPRQTVIAGPDEPLHTALEALEQAGFTWAPVCSSAPFHSSALQPLADAALPLLADLPIRPPRIPVISGYTGRRLSDAEAVDPQYWARHPVDPVLFWAALDGLLASGPQLLIECGPGQGLTILARRHPDVRSGRSRAMPLIGSAAPDPDGEAGRFAAAATKLALPVP